MEKNKIGEMKLAEDSKNYESDDLSVDMVDIIESVDI